MRIKGLPGRKPLACKVDLGDIVSSVGDVVSKGVDIGVELVGGGLRQTAKAGKNLLPGAPKMPGASGIGGAASSPVADEAAAQAQAQLRKVASKRAAFARSPRSLLSTGASSRPGADTVQQGAVAGAGGKKALGA